MEPPSPSTSTSKKLSFVWNYFVQSKDKLTAVCSICNKSLTTKYGSTRGLIRHLKGTHQIKDPNPGKRKLISPAWNYFVSSTSRLQAKCKICKKVRPSRATDMARHLLREHQTDITNVKRNEELDEPEWEDEVAESDVDDDMAEEGAGEQMCFICNGEFDAQLVPKFNQEQYKFFFVETLRLSIGKAVEYLKKLEKPAKWIPFCLPCHNHVAKAFRARAEIENFKALLEKTNREILSKIRAQTGGSTLRLPKFQREIVDDIKTAVNSKPFAGLEIDLEVGMEMLNLGHQESHLDDTMEEIQLPLENFNCPVENCDVSCSNKFNLNQHMKVHSGTIPCIQPNCEHVSLNERQDDRHQKEYHLQGLPSRQPTNLFVQNFTSVAAEDSKIVNDFAGICNVRKEGAFDYGSFATKLHPSFRFPTAVFESLTFADAFGPGPSFSRTSKTFLNDPNLDKELLPTDEDFKDSLYDKGHVAPCQFYVKNDEKLCLSFTFANCVAQRAYINHGQVLRMENIVKYKLADNGSCLVISLNMIPKKKEDLKLLNGRVAVPQYFGKIIIYRNMDGLHIVGLRSTTPNDEEIDPSIDKTYIPVVKVDPFKLAKDGGVSLECDPSLFATINDEPNFSNYVENDQVFPVYQKFFQLFD